MLGGAFRPCDLDRERLVSVWRGWVGSDIARWLSLCGRGCARRT